MIKFMGTKDYWPEPADIWVNCVNCKGVAGRGIALQFKNRFPHNFADYSAFCKNQSLVPGDIHEHLDFTTPTPSRRGLLIWNMATKDDWRFPSRIEWVEKGLLYIQAWLPMKPDGTILKLPLPGAGAGGLCPSAVADLIVKHLHSLPNHKVLVFPGPGNLGFEAEIP